MSATETPTKPPDGERVPAEVMSQWTAEIQAANQRGDYAEAAEIAAALGDLTGRHDIELGRTYLQMAVDLEDLNLRKALGALELRISVSEDRAPTPEEDSEVRMMHNPQIVSRYAELVELLLSEDDAEGALTALNSMQGVHPLSPVDELRRAVQVEGWAMVLAEKAPEKAEGCAAVIKDARERAARHRE